MTEKYIFFRNQEEKKLSFKWKSEKEVYAVFFNDNIYKLHII